MKNERLMYDSITNMVLAYSEIRDTARNIYREDETYPAMLLSDMVDFLGFTSVIYHAVDNTWSVRGGAEDEFSWLPWTPPVGHKLTQVALLVVEADRRDAAEWAESRVALYREFGKGSVA